MYDNILDKCWLTQLFTVSFLTQHKCIVYRTNINTQPCMKQIEEIRQNIFLVIF